MFLYDHPRDDLYWTQRQQHSIISSNVIIPINLANVDAKLANRCLLSNVALQYKFINEESAVKIFY